MEARALHAHQPAGRQQVRQLPRSEIAGQLRELRGQGVAISEGGQAASHAVDVIQRQDLGRPGQRLAGIGCQRGLAAGRILPAQIEVQQRFLPAPRLELHQTPSLRVELDGHRAVQQRRVGEAGAQSPQQHGARQGRGVRGQPILEGAQQQVDAVHDGLAKGTPPRAHRIEVHRVLVSGELSEPVLVHHSEAAH